jgi:dihydrofolate reductase
MIISAIAAVSLNNIIGRDNGLPWKLPADLRYFKNLTWGMPVIMGRKTFESMNGPLPGRTNIVITTNKDWHHGHVLVAGSLDQAIDMAGGSGTLEIFIAGGSEVFRQCMDRLDRIYLTRIMAEVTGDAYFPVLAPDRWELKKEDIFPADDKNPFPYSFQVWERKNARTV